MNEQGRHFRDQSCPENPTCDYESRNGIKCDFFEVGGDLAILPYPEDVSLGPIAPTIPAENSVDLAQLMSFLQQQKEDTDKKFASIQEQVNAIAQSQPTTSQSQPSLVSTTISQSIRQLPATPSSYMNNSIPSAEGIELFM